MRMMTLVTRRRGFMHVDDCSSDFKYNIPFTQISLYLVLRTSVGVKMGIKANDNNITLAPTW